MRAPPIIRRAAAHDADGIRRTILRAMRISNANDYPPHMIAAVADNFTPEHVLAQLAKRQVFVAVVASRVVGTASLHGRVVRSVYVDPDHQGTGIGGELMEAVEQLARSQSIDGVSVPS